MNTDRRKIGRKALDRSAFHPMPHADSFRMPCCLFLSVFICVHLWIRFSVATCLEHRRQIRAYRCVASRAQEGSSCPRAFRKLPPEGDRLAQLLGARINRNHYGEHLSLQQWYRHAGNVRAGCAFAFLAASANARMQENSCKVRGRSRAMAFPRHGNNRPRRRHGHVCFHGGHRVVGRGRLAGRAVFHARSRRRTFAAARTFRAHGGAARARDVQRKKF